MSLELNRKLAARRDPLPTSVTIDPVTADIIRGAFETVCFEAGTRGHRRSRRCVRWTG